jgi:cytochrome c oxidase accessory protein FixG
MNLARAAAREGDVVASEAVLSRAEHRRQPLFAGRIKVYPKAVTGRIRRIKWLLLAAMLAVYYLVPWIRWDRGPGAPDQAVLIDMPARRAYFFWIEIWPQEVYYLTGLLILAALLLFLATSIAGRVWCGFACPQTVWTDLFMWVERRIEGDRNARIRLDAAPLSWDKAWRKAAKHAGWLVIALATGGAWIMYFKDAPTVLAEFFTGGASATVYFFVGLFTATTYLLAGWAREQVCTYMCPWPRIQGALLDEESIIVEYEAWRGEPRGKHKRGQSWEGRGHCIDCRQCVAVCPTGIDIRDGSQLECIGCGLCADACDSVMDKVGLPRGLIAFDTLANQQRRAVGEKPLWRWLRARTVVYVALIAAVGAVMVFALGSRATVELHVLHDRSPLFVTLSDGSIRNGYAVKVLNKLRQERTFALGVEGIGPAVLSLAGAGEDGDGSVGVTAAPDGVTTVQLYVRVPAEAVAGEAMPVDVVLTEPGGGRIVRASVFRGPPR